MCRIAKRILFWNILAMMAWALLIPAIAYASSRAKPNEVRLYPKVNFEGHPVTYSIEPGKWQASIKSVPLGWHQYNTRSIAVGREVKVAIFRTGSYGLSYANMRIEKLRIIDKDVSDYPRWDKQQTGRSWQTIPVNSLIIFPKKDQYPTGVIVAGTHKSTKFEDRMAKFYPLPDKKGITYKTYDIWVDYQGKKVRIQAQKFQIFGKGLKVTLYPKKGPKKSLPESGQATTQTVSYYWPPYDSTHQNTLNKITVAVVPVIKVMPAVHHLLPPLCGGYWQSNKGDRVKITQKGDQITWESITQGSGWGGQAILRGSSLVSFVENNWPHLARVTQRNHKNIATTIKFAKGGLVLFRGKKE